MTEEKKKDEVKEIEAPKPKLFSVDGVPIPDEGVVFEFTRSDGVQKICLHDTLVGLRMKVPEGKNRSQAQVFASFATQMEEVNTEEDILRLFPAAKIDNLGVSRAYDVLGRMRGLVEARQQKKAVATMEANGMRVTEGQKHFALRLMDMLLGNAPVEIGDEKVIKGGPQWQPLVNKLALLRIEDSEEKPLGGQMSAAIKESCKILGIEQRQNSNSNLSTVDSIEEEPF